MIILPILTTSLNAFFFKKVGKMYFLHERVKPLACLPTFPGKSTYVWATVDEFSDDRNLENTEMDWDDK